VFAPKIANELLKYSLVLPDIGAVYYHLACGRKRMTCHLNVAVEFVLLTGKS